MCREHGQQLSKLAANYPQFGLWGLVKETGVDDEGLLEFYEKYYTYPLYQDTERATYEALGSRKIYQGLIKTWNPLKIYRGMKEMGQRLKEKQVEGNYVGEGLIQGGVLVLDSKGSIRFVYEEVTGEELDLDDIEAALALLADDAGVSLSVSATEPSSGSSAEL